MDWFLLIGVSVCQLFVAVAQKGYMKKVSGGGMSFSAMVIFFQIIFFAISSGGKLDFSNAALLPYAAIFGISFGVAVVGNFLAIQNGPLSLTTLFINFSLLIPTVYGIIFYDEPIGIFLLIGLVFLTLSIIAVNLKEKGVKEKKINIKWIVFTLLSFIGNGGCTTSQTAQQRAFAGAYKSELMIIALSIAFIAVLIFAIFSEKKEVVSNIKIGLPHHLLYGLCNGLVNLFVMMLTGRNVLPVSVIFPTISAAGIIGASVLAVLIYKEKLTKLQMVGIGLGAVAAVFLNM